jgi:hypothetical protein
MPPKSGIIGQSNFKSMQVMVFRRQRNNKDLPSFHVKTLGHYWL